MLVLQIKTEVIVSMLMTTTYFMYGFDLQACSALGKTELNQTVDELPAFDRQHQWHIVRYRLQEKSSLGMSQISFTLQYYSFIFNSIFILGYTLD
jgi:hypothetical protein